MVKIKSSLELALEKTKTAKKVDTVEMMSVTVQKYKRAAGTLAQSFLRGETTEQELKDAFARYPIEAASEAQEIFLEKITEEINLRNCPRVLQGIQTVKDDEITARICKEVGQLYAQYMAKKENLRQQLELNAGRYLLAELKKAGISGSAIQGINVETVPQWSPNLSQLEDEFQQVLQNFRSMITRGAGSS